MLTVYDVDFPEAHKCFYCNGTPVVNLAGADLCRYHADLEMSGWENYLPTAQKANQKAPAVQAQTVQENCFVCGSWGHKEEDCPRANR